MAIAGAMWATCTECRKRVDSAEQKQWMNGEAWIVTAPLPQIVRALHSMQVFIAPKDAKNWAPAASSLPASLTMAPKLISSSRYMRSIKPWRQSARTKAAAAERKLIREESHA